ncbi:hypothetical protein Pvag_1928 [Pantoea vagans C9-1]|nr:hypothetical protein Pvag_1928 [Pantoea vagans C9-1]
MCIVHLTAEAGVWRVKESADKDKVDNLLSYVEIPEYGA